MREVKARYVVGPTAAPPRREWAPPDHRHAARPIALKDVPVAARRGAAHVRPMSARAVFAAGYVGAQSQDVLGAYFPSWMLCVLAALAATAAIRWIFAKTGVDGSLPVPVVVYLALVAAFSLGGWLLWLG